MAKLAISLEFDMLVAFPGGNGTSDMIRTSEKLGLMVMKIESQEGDNNG